MGSKSYRLQVFALTLIGIVVLASNYGGFQTLISSESNELSTDSTSVRTLVESNEPPSERLTRPATNSAVELSSPPNGPRKGQLSMTQELIVPCFTTGRMTESQT